MSDPRYSDYSDPPRDTRFSDPVVRRRDPASDRLWGWIAGIAVLILVGFILAAGWTGSNTNSASNAPPATTGSAPSTTGSAPTPPPAPPSPAR